MIRFDAYGAAARRPRFLEAEPGGGLVGSYLVAFERAPEAPARGPQRLVIGGAFAAPRNRLPRAAALPRGGR